MAMSSFFPFRQRQTPRPSSFQILSDLHLEIGQQYQQFQVPPKAPNLVLAGDIGRLIDYDDYLQFLASQTSSFERVFLVLGNHEFYGMTFDAGIARARQLEKEPSLGGRLVLLHQTRCDDQDSGVTVLGCTLWSNIPAQSASVTAAKINDFKKIQGWTVDAHNTRFTSDLAWLEKQLRTISAAPTVPGSGSVTSTEKRTVLVVTHHAPCIEGTSRPKDSSNPWSAAFATDVLNTREWCDSGVSCWVFGHTHYTTEMVRQGVRVMSNQRGYVLPGQQQQQEETSKGKKKPAGIHEFDVSRVIEL
ncbi:hypothetical protein CONLIGDRAFT_637104 [Coniochaeta ligniaria NRRL 30616]|uniref:Calcineurin-like phosphoesterase domain-containing protein n=1 Tax=Coniochaeta ligniaria NRRL 30616 TaxID=1408157 RepID=A0A1J7I889_9PEZI|nr:hypothetical protein CONLIGDRAFT_637104 [Coniochaeta ligniaria NRRL 30616]